MNRIRKYKSATQQKLNRFFQAWTIKILSPGITIIKTKAMKSKFYLLLTMLTACFILNKANAQLTYYVDNKLYNGSPAGSGTLSDPWTTLSQVIYWWDTSNLRTQDVTIIFRSGTYNFNNGEALYIPADWGGKNGHYFILKAAAGEEVDFDGTNI